MENLNRKLILSNLKVFAWRLAYLRLINENLSYKWGMYSTQFILKVHKTSPEFKNYGIIFENKKNSCLGFSSYDKIDYVKLNIDTISENRIFNYALSCSVDMWFNCIPFIAWLYKYYPLYNVSFSDLEFKLIDYWFQSPFILDEVVKVFDYKPYTLYFTEDLIRIVLLFRIISKLFFNKYVFEVLLLWWNNQPLKTLTINFPFDITLLSIEAQLYFYFYHSFSSLSIDSIMILDANIFEYPPFDDTEKQMLAEFREKQRLNMFKLEDEIHNVYSPFITYKSIYHKVSHLQRNNNV